MLNDLEKENSQDPLSYTQMLPNLQNEYIKELTSSFYLSYPQMSLNLGNKVIIKKFPSFLSSNAAQFKEQ